MYNYNDTEEAIKGLQELHNGMLELSSRRSVPLKIDWVK
jgi:hypothetical protein